MNYNFLFFRFFPTKRNVNSWKLDKEIRRSLMKLVERRREGSSIINETHRHGPKDLLGLMIQASNSSKDVTVHDIVEECKSFFFAGKQTTSNLLTWTTVLLAMHPHWQVQAREEVLRVCGSRDIPTKDDVVKLKTVKPPSKTDKLNSCFVCFHIACLFLHQKKKNFCFTAFFSFFFFPSILY